MRVIQDQRAVLAHWVYTNDEWKLFNRWKKLRKGYLYYWFSRFSRQMRDELPEITITGQKVWTNDSAEPFMDNQHKLRRVNIRDTGQLNILEITYERLHGGRSKYREIRIPVPRGKLKEAIEVHDCLSGYAF